VNNNAGATVDRLFRAVAEIARHQENADRTGGARQRLGRETVADFGQSVCDVVFENSKRH